MRHFALATLILALAAPVAAGKYNPTLSVGDTAPGWEGLPGVDGKTYSLGDFKEAQVLVVDFTCNTCPYAVDHENRLAELEMAFQGRKVRLVAINCNAGDGDSLAAMQNRAKEKHFNFAYVKDTAGSVGRAFGATRTPEFVVLDSERKVVYLGAMDDDPKGRKVTRRYVENAIQAVLEVRQPEVSETPPIGCGVKYPRERRRREN